MTMPKNKIDFFEESEITDLEYAQKIYDTETTKFKTKLICCIVAAVGSVCGYFGIWGGIKPGSFLQSVYPNLKQDGSYGIKCDNKLCREVHLTNAIPKRGGTYSSIDTCFSVNINRLDNSEMYTMKSPNMYIVDKRTWGDVPIIKFNPETNQGYIQFCNQNGSIITRNFSIDTSLLGDGGWLGFSGKITESGRCEFSYYKLGFSGESS